MACSNAMPVTAHLGSNSVLFYLMFHSIRNDIMLCLYFPFQDVTPETSTATGNADSHIHVIPNKSVRKDFHIYYRQILSVC